MHGMDTIRKDIWLLRYDNVQLWSSNIINVIRVYIFIRSYSRMKGVSTLQMNVRRNAGEVKAINDMK